jgi:hypothetical protein
MVSPRAASEHTFNLAGPRLRLLGIVNAIENGVPIAAIEFGEEAFGLRVGVQGELQIAGNLGHALRRRGGFPSPIGLRALYLGQSRRLHSAGDD